MPLRAKDRDHRCAAPGLKGAQFGNQKGQVSADRETPTPPRSLLPTLAPTPVIPTQATAAASHLYSKHPLLPGRGFPQRSVWFSEKTQQLTPSVTSDFPRASLLPGEWTSNCSQNPAGSRLGLLPPPFHSYHTSPPSLSVSATRGWLLLDYPKHSSLLWALGLTVPSAWDTVETDPSLFRSQWIRGRDPQVWFTPWVCVELHPLPKSAQVLTSRTGGCDLIWQEGLCRCD